MSLSHVIDVFLLDFLCPSFSWSLCSLTYLVLHCAAMGKAHVRLFVRAPIAGKPRMPIFVGSRGWNARNVRVSVWQTVFLCCRYVCGICVLCCHIEKLFVPLIENIFWGKTVVKCKRKWFETDDQNSGLFWNRWEMLTRTVSSSLGCGSFSYIHVFTALKWGLEKSVR